MNLNEMVASINAACVLPEEILENHAYYYDRIEDPGLQYADMKA